MYSKLNSKEIFNIIYSRLDGHSIAREGRRKLNYFYSGHTYGEITYEGFSKMLKFCKPKDHEIFYDLGSGTGKAVILASLLANFSVLIGIEIINELHKASHEILNHYNRITEKIYFRHPKQFIDFINNDFANVDFSDADIIFMNATCFEYELNFPMIKKLDKLKKGARIITNTRFIKTPTYNVENIGTFPFSWGSEYAFLHTKK